MKRSNPITRRSLLRTAAILVAVAMAAAMPAGAAGGVDPAATEILKKMTDYLGGLRVFSVRTRNTVEDLLDSGQRVDIDISNNVVISRPNKLRAERRGDVVDQNFYYDGKDLVLYDLKDKAFASIAAPDTLEGMLGFAHRNLGLVIPASDLVYPDAYSLLMEGVTSAIVVGKAVVDGVRCDHLAFSRPGVDFQVWIAEEGHPLPYKYVVTDSATPALLSVSTVMSDWDLAPSVDAADFGFMPPEGAKRIPFMTRDANGASKQ